MTNPLQSELLGLDLQELTALVEKLGEPRFRARQLLEALYARRLTALDRATNLPRSLLARLAELGYIGRLPEIDQRFVSADGTVRYLIRFADHQTVEAVWMPDGDGAEEGDEAGSTPAEPSPAQSTPALSTPPRPSEARASGEPRLRATICLSSQSGCAVNCAFCMTARLGFERHLSAGEIVGQVLAVLNDHGVEIGRDRINLVFMGQGEPFLNYDNFIKAVGLLVSASGLSAARMTVSTSGIVPRIADFGAEAVRPQLAISLNAPNDQLRERLMPITRKWPLAMLMEAARQFPLRPRERLTFEYVLMAGVNDQPAQADELVRLLEGVRAKVNLIALNPGPEIPFSTPSPEAVEGFRRRLTSAGVPNYLRRPRGLDVYAACGQLKRSTLTPIS